MIKIVQADITTLAVDAVVNAANHSLQGGGGVDGAIHRAAGPGLLAFNRKLKCCRTGEAVISPGFDLQARWVISTVGPVWSGGSRDEADLLATCYHACFKLALANKLGSIAFPAISTGVYGYPKQFAARIALTVMREYEPLLQEIYACCFTAIDSRLYRELLSELSGDRPATSGEA